MNIKLGQLMYFIERNNITLDILYMGYHVTHHVVISVRKI
jgi:hypothetical protein